ncbi:MAG: CRISPR-associated protein Cas5 [Myxacorys chilensis ATA2-1-KO14]|jgi:CRISPR-associated protein Cas5d|nr:CRISPR-associated protein Cas5 [Myxacorys chilensis ATA2-1-KO14]
MREILIIGKGARFTRPELKADPQTYPVITPTAAVGILSAIYWKPEFWWRIRAITIMSPIKVVPITYNHIDRSSDKSIDIRDRDARMQRRCTELRDVCYRISAEIVALDGNPNKHLGVFRDRIDRGKFFKQPVMGTCEHFATVQWDDGREPAVLINQDFGYMPWYFQPQLNLKSKYTAVSPTQKGELVGIDPHFNQFRAIAKNSVITVPDYEYETF